MQIIFNRFNFPNVKTMQESKNFNHYSTFLPSPKNINNCRNSKQTNFQASSFNVKTILFRVKHEEEIDRLLAKVKQEVYNQVRFVVTIYPPFLFLGWQLWAQSFSLCSRDSCVGKYDFLENVLNSCFKAAVRGQAYLVEEKTSAPVQPNRDSSE